MSWKVRAEADGYDLSPLLRVCLCQKLQSCVLKIPQGGSCLCCASACMQGAFGHSTSLGLRVCSHPLSLLVSL